MTPPDPSLSPEPKTVNDITDFLDWVNTLRKKHWNLGPKEELWFRGEEQNFTTHLMPKLYRHLKINASPSSDALAKLFEDEDFLYQEFQRLGSKYVQATYPDVDWEWDSYFLMQAHQAPTRLLDFTDGALIALHFAVRQTLQNSEDHNGVVYALNPDPINAYVDEDDDINDLKKKWKDYVDRMSTKIGSRELHTDDWERSYLPQPHCIEDTKPPRPPQRALALDFPHFTSRIAAQRSRLIVFGRDPFWLQNKLKNEPRIVASAVIPKERKETLRQQLRDCGISESVIFPDLDGVGRELAQLWIAIRNTC